MWRELRAVATTEIIILSRNLHAKEKPGENQPGVRVWCKRNAVATTENLEYKINIKTVKEKPGESQPGVRVWCKRKAVATTENLDTKTTLKLLIY